MYVIVLSFLTAFTLTYFAIPSIILVAKRKGLTDEPNERSSHTVSMPSLGGIGIFSGAIFSIVLWTPFDRFGDLQYILCAFLILFLAGARDDLVPLSANKKLFAQLLAALILTLLAKVRLNGFYGLFGWYGNAYQWPYTVVSILFILLLVNAFNLIDGINGLAGSVGALIAGTLGCWFYLTQQYEFATIAFATVGAILAFLRYNFTPAQIFMGDTGALFIGLVSSILVIQFIDSNSSLDPSSPFRLHSGPAVAAGITIIPIFDTLRVFITRIIRGHSPFHADRRHIHHLLIDDGWSHMEATGILLFVNVIFITLVLALHDLLELHCFMLLILLSAAVLTYILHTLVIRKKQNAS
ncbi:MAG: MraY family glycosyltransferase [Bacteroidota bacterium]